MDSNFVLNVAILVLCSVASGISLKKIEINSASGTHPYHGHSQTDIENSWDGSHTIRLDDCYVTDDNKDVEASYTLKYNSLVSVVKLLKSGDCCGKHHSFIPVPVLQIITSAENRTKWRPI